MTITQSTREHLKVAGHKGTWYVIDEQRLVKLGFNGKVYLLEHETYGDEAACIIVDKELNIIMQDVYNGLDDLENL